MNAIYALVITIFLSIVSSQAVPVALYAQKVDQQERIPLGNIVFNETSGVARLEEAGVPFKEGSYCVGADIQGAAHCHSLTYLTYPLHHHLTITTKPTTGELVALSFTKGLGPGVSTTIKTIENGAQVPLITVKPPKITTEGQLVEEEEEDSRSFVQKYWMYIVPVLLLFLGSGGN